MPRKLIIQYPGAMYQVMNSGNEREVIFPHVCSLLNDRAEASPAQEVLPVCQQ